MRRKLSRKMSEGDVDLTPMLDIVFIMLIFFIVTATFVQEEGIDILRPDETDTPPPPNTAVRSPVTIQIAENNDVFIGTGPTQRRIDIAAVRANVERALVDQQTDSVIINAQSETDVEATVSVIDQCRQAGASISLRPGSADG